MDGLRVGVWKKAASGYRLLSNIHLDNPSMSASVSVAPRFNSAGTWSCSLPWDLQPKGLSKDHLFRFDFRGVSETCRIERFGVETDESGLPLLVVSGTTMTSMLGDAIGWPSPAAAAEDQLSVRWYQEGPAEDVLSTFISRNLVERLGYDVRVMPSQGRGLDVVVNSEFHNVLELVQDAATYAGLRLNVGLVDTSPTTANMQVWFDEPTAHDKVRLSAFDGNLRAYRKASEAPTATRAIVQAGKEQQGREVDNVNVSANRITVKPKQSKLRSGDIITFSGGVPPAPLESGVDYHAVRIDRDTFQVAMTRSDALRNVVVALTDGGSGKITVTESTYRYRSVTSDGPEAKWGRVREIFVEGDGENREAGLRQQGKTALLDGAANNSVELEIEEVPGARLGDPLQLGDTVPYVLSTGESGTEVIGSADITASSTDGVVVKLTLGNPDGLDATKQQAADIRRIKRNVRKRRRD